MTWGGEMCWLSVALRHQKLASPPVVPQMNSLLMRQPVCFVQYPHKYWSRPTASLSLCVCPHTTMNCKTEAADRSPKPKNRNVILWCHVPVCPLIYCQLQRLFRRRKGVAQSVDKHCSRGDQKLLWYGQPCCVIFWFSSFCEVNPCPWPSVMCVPFAVLSYCVLIHALLFYLNYKLQHLPFQRATEERENPYPAEKLNHILIIQATMTL